MRRFWAFLLWPMAEIALFVVVGGEIGLWATLGIIFVTALAGVILLRWQALRGAVLMRQGFGGAFRMREGATAAGLFRALGAVLLILPGFLGDFVGLLLFLPPVQKVLSLLFMRKLQSLGAGFMAAQPSAARARSEVDEGIIEGEWVEVPPHARRPSQGSGWITNVDPEDEQR